MNGSFFVPIRSALKRKNDIYLFAGGGITEKSESLKEWEETEIKLKHIGSHMQQFAQDIGRKTGVKRSLISSMSGKGIVILTPLFQKYIEMGLVCTDIEWIL